MAGGHVGGILICIIIHIHRFWNKDGEMFLPWLPGYSEMFVCVCLAFSANGKDVIVDFPQQSHWTGLLSEMELVPSVHPGVRYSLVPNRQDFLRYSA